MLIGSEGILGVITEAWVRVQARPVHREGASVALRELRAGRSGGAGAVAVGSPPVELPPAGRRRGGPDRRGRWRACPARAGLRVGRPSARGLDGPGARAAAATTAGEAKRGPAAAARAPGARPSSRRPTCATPSSPPASSATRSRPRSPGTASTSFVAEVRERAERALGEGRVTCRLTHVYPDGAAPYFTVLAPARRGSEVEQWDEVKAAASEAVIAAGRHDHPPPRGRPRPPALVRPSAAGAVRRGAAVGQARGRPGRDPQPRGADRPVTAAQARPGPRRPHHARPLAAAAAAAVAGRAARERVRDRGRQRRGARGHGHARAGRARAARAGARPGRACGSSTSGWWSARTRTPTTTAWPGRSSRRPAASCGCTPTTST